MTIKAVLPAAEQTVVSNIQKDYEALSDDGKKAVANGVSWAERNVWYVAGFFFVLGIIVRSLV